MIAIDNIIYHAVWKYDSSNYIYFLFYDTIDNELYLLGITNYEITYRAKGLNKIVDLDYSSLPIGKYIYIIEKYYDYNYNIDVRKFNSDIRTDIINEYNSLVSYYTRRIKIIKIL